MKSLFYRRWVATIKTSNEPPVYYDMIKEYIKAKLDDAKADLEFEKREFDLYKKENKEEMMCLVAEHVASIYDRIDEYEDLIKLAATMKTAALLLTKSYF